MTETDTETETGSAELFPQPTVYRAEDTVAEFASRFQTAEFVTIAAHPDGECVASMGVLAQACIDQNTPYQLRMVRTSGKMEATLRNAPAGLAVVIGLELPDGLEPAPRPDVAENLAETDIEDREPATEPEPDNLPDEGVDSDSDSEEIPESDSKETTEEPSETDASVFTDGGVVTPATDTPCIVGVSVDSYTDAPPVVAHKIADMVPGVEPDSLLAVSGLRVSPTYRLRVNPDTETDRVAEDGFRYLAQYAANSGATIKPDVNIPTDNVADGVGCTLRLTGVFSGDIPQTAKMLSGLTEKYERDDDYYRRLKEYVHTQALATADGKRAEDVLDALSPAVRFPESATGRTAGGYGEVIDIVSRSTEPSIATGLVIGRDSLWGEAVSVWKTRAETTQQMIVRTEKETGDGWCLIQDDSGENHHTMDVRAGARLVVDFMTDEPVGIVIDGSRVGIASVERIGSDIADYLEQASDVSVCGRERVWEVVVNGEMDGFIDELKAACELQQ